MISVSKLLPLVKANKHTFHNLDADSIESFQKEYNYLKQHADKSINELWVKYLMKELKRNNLDYIKKRYAMKIISQHLV